MSKLGGPLASNAGKGRGIDSKDGEDGLRRDAVVLDVGGVVSVRVRNARPVDLQALLRQLGTLSRPLRDGPADIEIEYTDSLPVGELHLIGQGDAATDGDGFYLWGQDRDPSPSRLDFGVDPPIRLQVPRGVVRIPVLAQLVSAAATAKGHVPLHASAFRWRGRGVLVAGWSKGGKTEALLSFMERGATYVGDEWMFMSPGEPVVGGIPEPIRIRDWHLDDLPALRRRVGRRDMVRLAALRAIGSGLRRVGKSSWAPHRVADLVDRLRQVQVDPIRMFGQDRCHRRSRIDVVFLMTSTSSRRVRAAPADPAATAARITASTTHEHLRLLEMELKRGFARAEGDTPLWEALQPVAASLSTLIMDLPVFEVTHPYPVSTPALFWVMAPLIEEVSR